jgi:hypothetical protein
MLAIIDKLEASRRKEPCWRIRPYQRSTARPGIFGKLFMS